MSARTVFRSSAKRWLTVAGAALLVGGVLVVPRLVQSGESSPAVSADPAALVAPLSKASDPEAIAAAFETALDSRGFAAQRECLALDTQGNPIAGADRVYAHRWVGGARAETGQELSLIAIAEAPMSLAEAQDDCERRLKAGFALSCVASTSGDFVVQDVERAAERHPDGWPVVMPDRWRELGKDLWFVHQSIVRSPTGTTVYALEATQATSLTQARADWRWSQEALRSAGAKLTVPLWRDTTECGWVVPELRDRYACAR